jgi:hypothetical protein
MIPLPRLRTDSLGKPLAGKTGADRVHARNLSALVANHIYHKREGYAMREELQKVRDWANEKIATGDEPPWAWFQYMKLRETVDQIIAGIDATRQEGLQRCGAHPEKHLRLVGETDPQDKPQPHQDIVPIQLPM